MVGRIALSRLVKAKPHSSMVYALVIETLQTLHSLGYVPEKSTVHTEVELSELTKRSRYAVHTFPEEQPYPTVYLASNFFAAPDISVNRRSI